MGWIASGAWIFAALLTLVVLGFCAYEIAWKAKRLRTNLAAVQADAQRLDGLRTQLAEVQGRLGEVRAVSAVRDPAVRDSASGKR